MLYIERTNDHMEHTNELHLNGVKYKIVHSKNFYLIQSSKIQLYIESKAFLNDDKLASFFARMFKSNLLIKIVSEMSQ